MTKEQILSGAKFSVFGINGYFEYLPESVKPTFILTQGDQKSQSPINGMLYDNHLSIFVVVFGIMQLIDIAYSHCEE